MEHNSTPCHLFWGHNLSPARGFYAWIGFEDFRALSHHAPSVCPQRTSRDTQAYSRCFPNASTLHDRVKCLCCDAMTGKVVEVSEGMARMKLDPWPFLRMALQDNLWVVASL